MVRYNTIDYSKTHFYKIISDNLNIKDCYVGHTTNFANRKSHHKKTCNNPNDKNYNISVYSFIREHGGWNAWRMILIETKQCDNKLEALKWERRYIEELNANLNIKIPTRTNKEYYEDNKETIRQWNKEYKENNKEKIKESSKEYRKNNKQEIQQSKKEFYQNNKEQILQYQKDYREDNKERIQQYQTKYYQNNKVALQEYYKQYRENNEEKIKESKSKVITCPVCNKNYTHGHKARHEKTKIHQNALKQEIN